MIILEQQPAVKHPAILPHAKMDRSFPVHLSSLSL